MMSVFFNYSPSTEIYTYCHTRSLRDALPIYWTHLLGERETVGRLALLFLIATGARSVEVREAKWRHVDTERAEWGRPAELMRKSDQADRKSTRLNSSH